MSQQTELSESQTVLAYEDYLQVNAYSVMIWSSLIAALNGLKFSHLGLRPYLYRATKCCPDTPYFLQAYLRNLEKCQLYDTIESKCLNQAK